MGQHSIPACVSCSGCSLYFDKDQGSGGPDVPTMSMGLNIQIPVEELITALMQFQQSLQPLAATGEEAQLNSCVSHGEVATASDHASDGVRQSPEATNSEQDQESSPVVARESVAEGEVSPRGGEEDEPHVSSSPKSSSPAVQSLALSSPWESMAPVAPPMTSIASSSSRGSFHRVKVGNLVKGLKTEDLLHLFSKQIGPVVDCSFLKGSAAAMVTFENVEHAQEAVRRYDGGFLEKSRGQNEVLVTLAPSPWQKNGADLRHVLEKCVGRLLEECQFRRGEGFLSIFHTGTYKELSRNEHQMQAQMKGAMITVTRDSDVPRKDDEVIIGEPLLL